MNKKRGPKKGTPHHGKPRGKVTIKGKPVPMSMAMIVLYFWGTP